MANLNHLSSVGFSLEFAVSPVNLVVVEDTQASVDPIACAARDEVIASYLCISKLSWS